jgi:hypothetical protein
VKITVKTAVSILLAEFHLFKIMAKDNTFNLVFDKFYQGMAPLAFVNPLTEVGGAGHAASMANCDIINGDYLTQGPALAILTNGSQAGVVSERINCILDKAVTDSVTYGIGATKLFKITPTAVTSDASFPQAITNCTEGCSVQLLKSKLYYLFNKSSGGEIGMYDLATTFDHDWGCYTEDTEVLTVGGWKKIKDVEVGADVYSLNPTTKKVEITTNKETINKPYDGEMVAFKNEGVDLVVTPDHKMFAGFRKMNDRKTYTDWKIVRADSLLGKSNIRLKKNAEWDGVLVDTWTVPEYDNGSRQVIVRDNKGRIVNTSGKRYYKPTRQYPIKPFLRLLGFYISEGSSSEKHINLAQRTYSKGWQPMKDTLDELGVNYGYHGKGFDIYDKQLTQYIKSIIPGLCHEKRIPREILELHPSLLIELYEALMLGDGYLDTNQYYTVSEGLRDDFVELTNKLGWSAKVFVKDRRGQKAYNGIARYIAYTIGVTKEKNETRLTKYPTKEAYKGNIVCLSLDKNHIMLVRRNGKSVWCGNSTVPTGAAALQNAPHPSDKKEDIMLFGNGRYAGVYIAETNVLDVDKLDFGADCEVADIVYNAGYWYIAVNSGVTGTNRSEGQIYLYDGSATTSLLQDETGVGMQRIGFLYRINGIIYVVYQDITSTGVNIGYIVGSQISPLKKFVGTLPNYQQKTLYRNTILFHSSGNIFSAGAMIDDLPFQISQIADGGYANVGAIAAPFGTPMVASSETTAFTAAVDNIITSASHGLVNGDTVLLTTTTSLPGGLSLETLYYVISKTDNTFKVSLTLNGDEVDITSVGTGIHYWNRYKLAKFSGYDVNCSWKTIIVPTIQDGILGYIDSITVLTTSLGANASCSVSIEANQGINSSNTLTVTGADKRIHTLSALGLGRIEDLRIYLNWSEGNATNPCPIRKIFVKGHYLEG